MKDYYDRNIDFVESKEGLQTVMIDNILLHSKYYPEKEAVNFINNFADLFDNKNTVVVYGLALGYHVKYLLSIIDKNCKVKIFDVDEGLFSITRRLDTIKEIIDDKRVELHMGYTKAFLDSFVKSLEEVEDFILYKPSIKVLPRELDDFIGCLERFVIGKTAVENHGQKMIENDEANSKIPHDFIEGFLSEINLKNKPIMIVSAGPSLDSALGSIDLIKKNITIFAVGSALKPLLSYGIEPDMFCITDPEDITYKQMSSLENMSIPLCFLNTASNKTVAGYNGPKYMFYNESKENNIVIDTGKSVATAVLSIAIEAGGNPILFVGQDLAYLSDQTHCREYPIENKIDNTAIGLKKVLGVDGSLLDTTPVLLYFKNWIENMIRENPEIMFINCSKGARIEGTKEVDMTEIVKKYI